MWQPEDGTNNTRTRDPTALEERVQAFPKPLLLCDDGYGSASTNDENKRQQRASRQKLTEISAITKPRLVRGSSKSNVYCGATVRDSTVLVVGFIRCLYLHE